MKSSKYYSVSCFVLAIAAAVFVEFFLLWGATSMGHAVNPDAHPTATEFDTAVVEKWCSKSNGTIRLVGGWYYEPGTLEDEQGNLWGWSGEVEENAFLLLWIDDNGTPEVEDDEVLKVWQEI